MSDKEPGAADALLRVPLIDTGDIAIGYRRGVEDERARVNKRPPWAPESDGCGTPGGLARLFHETYEHMATEYGYKTQATLVATCGHVLAVQRVAYFDCDHDEVRAQERARIVADLYAWARECGRHTQSVAYDIRMCAERIEEGGDA